jgi:hypothetical protein
LFYPPTPVPAYVCIPCHNLQQKLVQRQWNSERNCFPELRICFLFCVVICDRLCGLVLTVPCCRHRGPGFNSRHYQIFRVALGLERGPLSSCEDKWGATWKKSSGSGLENWD